MQQSKRQQRKSNRPSHNHKIKCASRYTGEHGSRPVRRASDRLKRSTTGIESAKKADSRGGGKGYQIPGATNHW